MSSTKSQTRSTTFYPFEIEPTPDSCWSIHAGPDGRIYVAACCEHISGGVAHIMRYNEQTDSLDHVLNVAAAVGEPPDSGRASQCKIHDSFAPSAEDGILYAATHLSAPGVGQKQFAHWGEWKNAKTGFPGSYLIAYDTRRDEVAWTCPFIPYEGCRCLALDNQRGRLYAMSYPRDHFWVFDLSSRELRSFGRLGSVNSQTIFTDRRGRVFTSNDQGQIVRFDPDTDVLEELPIFVPYTEGLTRWHNVFYDIVASPAGDCVYGVPWAIDPHLFRYWPEEGPNGRMEDLGPVHQRRDSYVAMSYGQDHCGGLVFGADGMLYYVKSRWPDGQERRPRGDAMEGVVVQMDPASGKRCDFAMLTRQGGMANYASRGARDRFGHLYFGQGAKTGVGMARLVMDHNGDAVNLHEPLRTWG